MTARPGQVRLTTIPLSPKQANDAIQRWHRHHGPIPVGLVLFCLGAVNPESGDLVGAAVVSRPANRNSDDGQTGEVGRVATDGTPNACSLLYGACAAAAKRMGFSKLITYTLDTEPGASLRGAGWIHEAEGINSNWHRPLPSGLGRIVKPREHYNITKQRWAIHFRAPILVTLPDPGWGEQQPSLFTEAAP